jgi:hypothetical protein
MRFLIRTVLVATFALAPLAVSAQAQEPAARRQEAPPAAVVLSNGQRWERISLRHIDARVLAPLFGATLLPTAEPTWISGPMGHYTGVLAAWSPAIATLLPFFQQGGTLLPPGGAGAPGATGPANPAGLPVLVDPVTNALIVDP